MTEVVAEIVASSEYGDENIETQDIEDDEKVNDELE